MSEKIEYVIILRNGTESLGISNNQVEFDQLINKIVEGKGWLKSDSALIKLSEVVAVLADGVIKK